MRHFIVFLTVLFIGACSTSKDPAASTENSKEASSVETITVPVVKKEFYNKVGEPTGIMEYYLQRSIKDYFIKFCDSDVTVKEVEKALKEIDGPIKQLTLTIETLDGEWDNCDGYPVQSRVGEYVIIKEIVE